MKRDVRTKTGAGLFSGSKLAKLQLVRLLQLSGELEEVYRTYPQLQAVVGHEAWQQLTDLVYAQLLDLNADPRQRGLRAQIEQNMVRLEDISATTLVRGDLALRDTLSRVLMFRITNGLATEER